MKDNVSAAAWVVCPMCDEKKCVGRYNCKWIADYLKSKLVEIDHVRRAEDGK